MAKLKYKRILLKLSGESLMGKQQYGIDHFVLAQYTEEIKSVIEQGVQVAIVIGGGNIFRGMKGSKQGFDRTYGDYMGMLATAINSIALKSEFENLGIKTKLLSGLRIDPVCELTSGPKAIEYMSAGNLVIIAGGTGNPYFTTDTASSLRAVEIKADVILKGTRVDGIYTADPEKVKSAKKYDTLTFDEAVAKKLSIMDLTAFTLCQENKMPIIVFDMNKKGNLRKIVKGDKVGTLVIDK